MEEYSNILIIHIIEKCLQLRRVTNKQEGQINCEVENQLFLLVKVNVSNATHTHLNSMIPVVLRNALCKEQFLKKFELPFHIELIL